VGYLIGDVAIKICAVRFRCAAVRIFVERDTAVGVLDDGNTVTVDLDRRIALPEVERRRRKFVLRLLGIDYAKADRRGHLAFPTIERALSPISQQLLW